MPLVSSSLPNMINGVSQQPGPIRLRTSCTDMVNAFPSVISGLQKRPASEYIASLSTSLTVGNDAAIHTIDRDANERYIVIVVNGDLEVYDLAGTKQTISFPNGKTYLSSTAPNKDFRFLTIADTTFVVNRSETVTSSAVTETSDRLNPDNYATVYVKQAVANVTYAIYVNNVLKGQFTTGANTTATDALEGTNEIADQLKTSLTGNGISAVVYGSTISISGLSANDVVSVEEGFGGRSMTVFRDVIQSFDKLPPTERLGRIVKVSGDIEEAGDDYYVRWDGDVWIETYGYNEGSALTQSTMPHILVRQSNGTFVFKPQVYPDRLVGDTVTNKDPSFVDNKINDIFLHKNRMGLLSTENVIFSEVANFENFFRTTAVQLLDSDRIDVASTTNRISTLNHAVPFSNNLVLFSDKVQFQLGRSEILSPQTISLTLATTFDCSRDAAPVSAGPNLFFAVDGEQYAGVRELFVDTDTDNSDAAEVSIQVPRFIPSNIIKMAASTKEDILVCVSSDDRNKLYIYKWYYSGQNKVQSSWGTWKMPNDYTILSCDFLDADLYVVYKKGSEVCFDKIEIQEGDGTQGTPSKILLDRQIKHSDVTMSYNASADETTVTLPYTETEDKQAVLTDDPYGATIIVKSQTSTTMVLDGDQTSEEFIIGVPYTFTYEYSPQYYRQGQPGSEISIQDGRFQMRYFSILYVNSAFFNVQVTPKNRDTREYRFTGRVFGEADNKLGSLSVDTGTFRVPIFAKNDDVVVKIVNDTPFPCAFSTTEYEAMYYPRTRRV